MVIETTTKMVDIITKEETSTIKIIMDITKTEIMVIEIITKMVDIIIKEETSIIKIIMDITKIEIMVIETTMDLIEDLWMKKELKKILKTL